MTEREDAQILARFYMAFLGIEEDDSSWTEVLSTPPDEEFKNSA